MLSVQSVQSINLFVPIPYLGASTHTTIAQAPAVAGEKSASVVGVTAMTIASIAARDAMEQAAAVAAWKVDLFLILIQTGEMI